MDELYEIVVSLAEFEQLDLFVGQLSPLQITSVALQNRLDSEHRACRALDAAAHLREGPCAQLFAGQIVLVCRLHLKLLLIKTHYSLFYSTSR